jgi:hypothetical protein
MKPIMFTTGNSVAVSWGPFQRGTRIRGIRIESAPDAAADLGFGVNIVASRDRITQGTFTVDSKSLIDTRPGEGDPLATFARIPVGGVWIPLNLVVKTCVYIGMIFTDLGGATGDVDGIASIDTDQTEEI